MKIANDVSETAWRPDSASMLMAVVKSSFGGRSLSTVVNQQREV